MSLARYSRRALLARPGRTILTLLSIVIGVTAVVSVTVVADTTREAYKTMFATVRGKATLEVKASNAAAFPEELVAQIAKIRGVAAAVPVIEKDGSMTVGEGDAERQVRLRLLGVDPERDHLVRDLEVVDGRFVQEGDEVLFEADFAQQLGIKVGDEVRMSVTHRLKTDETRGRQPMKLAGVVKSKGAEALLQTGLVFMPLKRAQVRFLKPGQINAIQIVVRPGMDEAGVQSEIAKILPPGLECREPGTGAQMLEQTLLSTNQGLRLTTAFSLLLAGFIILNTFLMNVSERRRHLSITRAIGATRGQLAAMQIGEALLLGFFGTVLGIGVGLFSAHYLNIGLSRLLDVSLPSMQLSLWPFLWAVVFGFVVSLVGAVVPVVRVARLSPLEGMSRVIAQDFSQPPIGYQVLGALITLVSGALILGGIYGLVPIIIPTFAAVGLHLGIVLMYPLVLAPLAVAATGLLAMLNRAERSLALKQILRHRGRTSVTVGVLFIAGSTGLAMAHSILDNVQDLNDWRDSVIIGDYYIRDMVPDMATGGSADLPPELDPELRQIRGIANLDRVKFTDFKIGEEAVKVIARDFRDRARLPLDLQDGNPDTVRRQLADGEVIVSSILAQKLNVKVGDRITLEAYLGEDATAEQKANSKQSFLICGTVNEYMVGGLAVYLDWDVAVQELGISGVDGYAVRVEEGRRTEVEAALAALCKKYGVLLNSKADISRSIARMSNGISGLNWGLVGLGFVVAAFGVVNTLSMNVLEQTRELGLLRIVAMTRRQVRRTIIAQALIIGTVGLVPGVLCGYCVAYVMNLAMEPSFGRDIQFHQRPELLLLTLSIALVITLIAAWIPARRAASVDLATALHYE